MSHTVHVETTHFTYVELDLAVAFLRRSRSRTKRGQFYRDLGIIVFSAFTIEAYLNHVGSRRFADWSKVERELDHKAKLKRICKEFGVAMDTNSQVYQDFVRVFQLRDSLAHGKTTSTKEALTELQRAKRPEVYFAESQMTKLGERGEFLKYSDSIRNLVITIHESFAPGKNPFSISETAEEWSQ